MTIDELIAQIKAHPMCAQFVETPQRYIVYYPAGKGPLGGTTIARVGDDARTLALLLKRLPAA